MLMEMLNYFTPRGSFITWKDGNTRISFCSVVSYGCEILEAKDVSIFLHASRVQSACVRSLITLNGIQDLRTGQVSFAGTRKVLNRVKDTLASHKSLEHREYPAEEVAINDQIAGALKQLFIAP